MLVLNQIDVGTGSELELSALSNFRDSHLLASAFEHESAGLVGAESLGLIILIDKFQILLEGAMA